MIVRNTLLPSLMVANLLIAQPGIVHHWPLDESTGTYAQNLAGASPGSLQGGTLWAPTGGYHGGAARFDGVDDRVLLGPCDLFNGGTGITLSLWVKPDFVTAMERTLIAKTVGPQGSDHIWSLAFVNATALRFRLRTGGTTHELSTPPSSLFGGTWYHIVASYDGSMMRIHVNGALMAFAARSGSIGSHPTSPASLGALSTGAAPFSGWIDDARIYERGLSEPEILGILLGSVSTSVGQVLTIDPSGRTSLPAGDWETIRVVDATGRIVREDRVVTGSDPRPLQGLTTGLYLVCLRSAGEERVTRVFIP